jgi:hypothetical protein
MPQNLPPVQLPPEISQPQLVPFEYDGRTYWLENLQSFYAHVTLTRGRNLLAAAVPGSIPPPTDAAAQEVLGRLARPPERLAPAAPAKFSLAQWQTPIRDQQDRDTCWAFAGLAALEAAYMRGYGVTLDLSEQYFFHICRATSLAGNYMSTNWQAESATSMWGAGGNSGSIASLETWWVPLETEAPYQTQSQLLALAASLGVGTLPLDPSTTQEQIDLFEWDDRLIPRAARWNCVYGVTSTTSLPDLSIGAIKSALLSDHEVVVDISTHIGYDSTGRWVYQYNPQAGGHVFVIIGYDDNDVDGTFLVKNSWGGNSYTRVAYSFFTHVGVSQDRDSYFGGNYITGIVPPSASPQQLAWWLGRWNQDHDGWRGTHMIRRFTSQSNPTKLGNYYRQDGTKFDVNGYMDAPGKHASFWIAATPGKIQPGTLTGQLFDTYVFSWEPQSAAGTTSWSDITFGAQLCLDPIAPAPAQSFSRDSWLGTWAMDHDGWQGDLTVSAFGIPIFNEWVEVTASYAPVGGSALPTAAMLWVPTPHRLTVFITFADGIQQPFDLYHHTWEADIFSGTTQWSGITFGVKGRKQT